MRRRPLDPSELVRRLRELAGPGLLDALEQAARQPAAQAIPALLPVALRDEPITGPAALLALARSYAALSAGELVRLDRGSRHALPLLCVEEVELHRHLLQREHGWTVAAALASHSDGYVRELATRWLDAERSGAEIPLLMLRMNDWVAPIRSLARDAMEQRLRPSASGALVLALPMLRRLERWGRADHSGFVRRALELLRRPGLEAARERGLASPVAAVRREAFRLALDAAPGRALELIRRAARDPDRAVRRWALGRVLRERSLRDPALLEAFLLDDELVHRQEAQRLLRQLEPPVDLAAYYRAALVRGDRSRPALFGLGECGDRGDVELALPFLEHPYTALRRAAIYALGWLDSEGQAARLAQALADERRRVSNDAANTLVRSAHVITGQQASLERLAARGETDFCRDNARTVLEAGAAYRERWTR